MTWNVEHEGGFLLCHKRQTSIRTTSIQKKLNSSKLSFFLWPLFSPMNLFANVSGQTNWCLTWSKCLAIKVDHSKSRKYRLKNFTRKKFKAKKKKRQSLKPVYSRPLLSNKIGESDFFPIVFSLFVFLGKGAANGWSLLSSDSLRLFADCVFSKWGDRFPIFHSRCPRWSHSFELKVISADHWNCRSQRVGECKFQ